MRASQPGMSVAHAVATLCLAARADIIVNQRGTSVVDIATLAAGDPITAIWHQVPDWTGVYLSNAAGVSTQLFAKVSPTGTAGLCSPATTVSPEATSYCVLDPVATDAGTAVFSMPSSVALASQYYLLISQSSPSLHARAGSPFIPASYSDAASFSLPDMYTSTDLYAASTAVPASTFLSDAYGGPALSSPSPTLSPSPFLSPILSSSTAPISSAASAEITTGLISSATPVANSSSKSGLSKGAIAGIAVGVVVGMFAIFSAAFLIWRRKTQQNRKSFAGTTITSHSQQALNRTAGSLHAEKQMRSLETSRPAYAPVDPHASFDDIQYVVPPSIISSSIWIHAEQPVAPDLSTEDLYQASPPPQTPMPSTHAATAAGSVPPHAIMTPEEQARWDEEEARIDEAIAAAERNRH